MKKTRIDENGNRYFRVMAAKNICLANSYRISDYYMRNCDYGLYGSHLDTELRKFLVIKFGAEYLESLHGHLAAKADDEYDEIRQFRNESIKLEM